MKYSTLKDAEGKVHLKLGLNHVATFDPNSPVEAIVGGVEELIQTVVGVSAFELVLAVMKAATEGPVTTDG